jgi:hypothetical protein
MSRPFILDGVTIQLAGELLFNLGTPRGDRERSYIVYRDALWDFGYAVLFGESLRWAGSLTKRNGDLPGQAVIDFDQGALFKGAFPAGSGFSKDVLKDPSARGRIASELAALDEVFGKGQENSSIWESYIQLEATLNLPSDPVPAENPQPGARFDFSGGGVNYLNDATLQNAMSNDFVSALVSAFIGNYPRRKRDDLHEFVQRVLLTHYTISCWYDTSAYAADFIRIPFRTRSAVRSRAALSSFGIKPPAHEYNTAMALQIRLTSEALSRVFDKYRSPERRDIYYALYDSRKRYASHRECLAAVDFFLRAENYLEKELNDALSALEKLLHDERPQTLIYTDGGGTPYLLLQERAVSYPECAYHIFPELQPMPKPSSTKNVFNGPVGIYQQGDYNTASSDQHDFTYGTQELSELSDLLREFDSHLHELRLTESEFQNARVQLATIGNQLSGGANSVILRQAGRSLRSITEGAIGSLIATSVGDYTVWTRVMDLLQGLCK